MKVRWTRLARSDLDNTQRYISEHNPGAALKVGARIHDAVRRLEKHPHLGRIGTIPGTREKLALPYPYVIVYEVAEDRDEIWILRVFHMAQDRRRPE
jgi:addiction module RelE/StbE family toxin